MILTEPHDTSALELRSVKLRKLVAQSNKVILTLGDLYAGTKAAKLKSLTAALKTVEGMRELKVTGARKHLDNCQNELVSLREGVFTGAKLKKADYELTACVAAKNQFAEMIGTTASRITKLKAENAGVSITAEDESQNVIIRNLKESSKLPDISKKLFTVARAPVVVVTSTTGFVRKGQPSMFVDRNKLANSGFKVEAIDGYAILHDQLVVGINPALIPTGAKGKKEFNTQHAFAEVLSNLKRTTKKNYSAVISASHTYKGGVWFWVMTEAELNLFSKAFPGGHPTLNEWGFAFSLSNTTTRGNKRATGGISAL